MPWNLFPTRRPTLSRTSLDILLLFGLTVLFYGQPFLNPTRISYGGDAFSLFLPALDHYRRAMFSGIIPLWNANVWLGAPFLASYQSAVLYPPQVLSLLFKSTPQALNFSIFLGFFWLTCGAYVFGLRALRLGNLPSLFMGVVVGCSGFIGGHADHVNQVAALSWVPWILTEALSALRTPRLRHAVVLALCFGMQTLAGHPQHVIYTLVYLGMLVVVYSVYYLHRRRIEDPPEWTGVVLIATGVLLGLGIGAAQILPSAELSGYSIRQIDPPERMLRYSFPPKHLLTLVYPNAFGNPVRGLHALDGSTPYDYNFGEYLCHLGIIPLLLALIAIITLSREFVVRCFLFLGFISLLVAFGGYANGVFYRLAFFWFPGIVHMRVPARFLFFFVFSMSALAAVGFNQVVFYASERRRVRPRFVRWLQVLVLVFTFAELYLFSYNLVYRYHGTTEILDEKGPLIDLLTSNRGEHRCLRIMDEVQYTADENRALEKWLEKKWATKLQLQRLQPNLNVLHQQQICRGYEEGLLPTLSHLNFMERYNRNLYSPSPDTRLLGLMNIRYVIADKPIVNEQLEPLMHRAIERVSLTDRMVFSNFREYPFHDPDANTRFFSIFKNRDFIPRFAWGDELRQGYVLEMLDVSDTSCEYNAEAGYREPNYSYRLGSETARARAVHETAEMSTFDTHRPNGSPNSYALWKPDGRGGEIVMLMGAYPGWVCRLEDGRVLPMRRVNAVMMSCSTIPSHGMELRFNFEPMTFRVGLFLSCCALMLVSFMLFASLVVTRRLASEQEGKPNA